MNPRNCTFEHTRLVVTASVRFRMIRWLLFLEMSITKSTENIENGTNFNNIMQETNLIRGKIIFLSNFNNDM